MGPSSTGRFRGLKLFLLFTLIPAAELYGMIRLGSLWGAEATVAVVVATGVAGALLVRREWRAAHKALRRLVEEGAFPPEGLITWVGACLLVLVGGVLLLTPGILTDLLGIALMIPLIRNRVSHRLAPYVEVFLEKEGVSQEEVFGKVLTAQDAK